MISTVSATYNREIMELVRKKKEHVNVLIIGNNPIEITSIYNGLNEYRGKNYIADVCFNIKDSLVKMIKRKPDCILLDDNLLLDQIKLLISKIRENSRFSGIPIVLLKSSNFNFAFGNEVQDFLLKANLSTEILSSTIEKNISLLRKLWK